MHKKVALITGAARRIGAAIAKRLHAAKYNVMVHCNNSIKEGEALVALLNAACEGSACLLRYDLSQESSLRSLIEDTCQWKGRLDLLVNNASLFYRDPSTLMLDQGSVTTDQNNDLKAASLWNDLFHLNVRVPFFLSQYASTSLKENKGAIINLTDIHADKPLKDYAIYSQTKAALVMQTKALAREFAPDVRVNAVAPGAIAWPEHGNQLSQTLKEKIVAQTPLKRHGDPAFVAEALLALAENAFITGQVLNVDGGRSII